MIEYKVKVYDNGFKQWWLHGQIHREDGPAIEYSNGTKFWYLNGQKKSFFTWCINFLNHKFFK